MSYKIGDKVLCKKTKYNFNWFTRLILFDKSHFFKKGEKYYITGFDDNGMPDTLYFYTERECEKRGINILKELSRITYKRSISSIAWNNDEKIMFNKYFYSDKEIRKEKLKKLSLC